MELNIDMGTTNSAGKANTHKVQISFQQGLAESLFMVLLVVGPGAQGRGALGGDAAGNLSQLLL